MKFKLSNIIYIVWIIFLGVLLLKDFFYIIPYNIDPFSNIFWPIETKYSLTWLFILFASIFSIFPLIKNKKIGYLAVVILILTVLKPIVKGIPKKETAQHFFELRESKMTELVESYKTSNQKRIISTELENINIEQLMIEGDTYIFIIRSLLDNSYGFVYDLDGVLPESILSATTHFEHFKGKWYKYSTT